MVLKKSRPVAGLDSRVLVEALLYAIDVMEVSRLDSTDLDEG